MKEWLRTHFSLLLSLVTLILIIILAYAIVENPTVEKPTLNTTLSVNESRHDQIINPVDPRLPVHREDVIVYFKKMPDSIDAFASTYGVSPIFIKADIKMAAFETDPVMIGGIVSEKTTQAIEKISKDPLVELVKRDTYMFVNREREINSTPEVRYPEYYDQKGVGYVPNQVIIGFWRLPLSLEEFGAVYGGKPVNVTEGDLQLQSVLFETEDMKGFMERASKNPYVRWIDLNTMWKLDDPGTIEYILG